MFQDPSDFYYQQNENLSPGLFGHGVNNSTLTSQICTAVLPSGMVGHGVHSTPNSQGTESETSFDSGYLSPVATQNIPGSGYCPLPNEQYIKNVSSMAYRPSPTINTNQKSHFDDEWDKKFIENFEANLFGIDPTEDFSTEDINLFSELLSSPLKTGLSPIRLYDRNSSPSKYANSPSKYANSPLKMFFSPPKSLNSRRSLLASQNPNWSETNVSSVPSNSIINNDQTQLPVTQLSETILNFKHENEELSTQSCLLENSLSTHNYAKSHSLMYVTSEPQQRHSYSLSRAKFPELKPALLPKVDPSYIDKNISPELLPSKQKLQYVRAKFRQTLQRAVENANNSALNEEKYPQLTKRLLKCNSDPPATKLKENVPRSTVVQGGGQRSSSSSLSATHQIEQKSNSSLTAHKQRFRELAPAPSQKRTFAIINNQYEVQKQADCQIVIKKRKTY